MAEELAGLSGDDGTAAPALQLLTSACWLTLKEAGLLMGILARHIPLLGRFWIGSDETTYKKLDGQCQ